MQGDVGTWLDLGCQIMGKKYKWRDNASKGPIQGLHSFFSIECIYDHSLPLVSLLLHLRFILCHIGRMNVQEESIFLKESQFPS